MKEKPYRRGVIRPVLRFFRESKKGVLISRLILWLFPLYCVFSAELMHSHSIRYVFGLLIRRPQNLLLGAAVFYAIFWSLFLLLRQAWMAGLLTGLLAFLSGGFSYYKKLTVGDYLYPWDFFLLRDAGTIAEFGGITVTFYMVALFILLCVMMALLVLGGKRICRSRYLSVPASLVLALLVISVFRINDVRDGLLHTLGMEIDESRQVLTSYTDNAYQAQNYKENGFLGGFFVNIGNIRLPTPKDYSRTTIDRFLSDYPPVLADADFTYPDVVAVLSEALWDPTDMENVTFSRDPMPNIHALASAPNTLTGKHLSPTFGGGTVRPEFEALTGLTVADMPSGSMPYQQYVKKPLWSYATYFSDLGYDTVGLHTFNKRFYDRNKTYPLMGFEQFYGDSDLDELGIEVKEKGPYISDETFTDTVISLLENATSPLFLFGVTMQNHGPYQEKYGDDCLIDVSGEDLDEENTDLIKQYTEGVRATDQQIGRLIQYIDSRERPTVLLIFGDHLPSLGNYYSPYIAAGYVSGANSELWNEQERMRMYGAVFLIHANFPLENNESGDIGYISSSRMLGLLTDSIGAPKTRYMKFMWDFYQKAPVFNSRLIITAPGVDPEEVYPLAEFQQLITYDRLTGRGYSNFK